MRSLLILIVSLCLTHRAYAHTSLLPHIATDSELLHALMHTGLAVLLAVVFYRVLRTVLATAKSVRFKRH